MGAERDADRTATLSRPFRRIGEGHAPAAEATIPRGTTGMLSEAQNGVACFHSQFVSLPLRLAE
jgi:hypothetical protein